MENIATIGFRADVTGLKKAERGLDNLARKGEASEKRLTKSVDKTNKSFNSLKASIGAAGIALAAFGAATVSLTRNASAYAREMKLASNLSGVAAKELHGMAFATKSVGIELQKLGDISKDTLEKVGDFLNTGGGGFQDFVDAMKLTKDEAAAMANEFKNLTGPAVLQEMVTRMEAAEVSAVQMSHALEGMASDTTNLLPLLRNGGEAMRELQNRMASVTVPLTNDDLDVFIKMGESADLATESIKSLGNTIMLDLSDAFIRGADTAAHFYASLNKGTDAQKTTRLADIKDEIDALRESMVDSETVTGRLFNVFMFRSGEEKFAQAEINELMKERLEIQADLAKSRFGIGEDEPKKAGGVNKATPISAEAIKMSESIDKVNASLEQQIIALRDGEAAAELYNIRQSLGLKIGQEIPASILARVDALRLLSAEEAFNSAQRDKFDKDTLKAEVDKATAKKKAADDFEDLTDQVDNFGGAWSRTGNIIVDAFGDMGKALDDYSSRMSGLDKLQNDINESRKQEGADTVELSRLQMAVDNERVSAELAGMSAVSNGVGSLFDEKTAASKSFAALSKIIAVAEIAMSFQKITAGTAEAGAHVINEGTKQSANALTAITGAFAAQFPIGFVAGAAMIGIMGSLVGGISGGGSFNDPTQARQDAQGTGSVFGSDEKSGSILAAQDRFEDVQLDQLGELRGIRGSMTELSNGISLATRSLIASGGEFSGDLSGSSAAQSGAGKVGSKILSGLTIGLSLGLSSLGGISDKLISAVFGSTKKKVTDTGIQFISSTLGDIIEGGIVGAQQFFDITKTKKKLFGLSKKVTTSTQLESVDASFEAQIGGIFASIGTVIGESAALLGFDIDDTLNAFQIDLGKISLEGMSGEEIEKELSAVFSQQADLIAGFAIPALSDYQKVGEGAFETLTRVTHEQAAFNDTMDMLGQNFGSLSSIMQIDIAQSLIDLTGGFEQFNSLTSEYFSEFFTETEQFERLTGSLTDVFADLNITMPSSKAGFRDLVESLDLTSQAGQETFAVLMQLVPGMTEYFEGLETVIDGTGNYTDALNDAMGVLKQSVSVEKDRAQEVLTAAKEIHNIELDRIATQRAIILEQHDLAVAGVESATDALNKSFEFERNLINEKLNLEKNAIREASSARLEELNSEKQLLDGRKSGLSSIINNMTSLSARLTKAATASSSDDITAALLAARGGDFSKAEGLSGKLPTSGSFGTAAEFRAAQGLAQNQLGSIAGLASNRAGGAQSELDILESMSLALTEQMQVEKDRTQVLLDKADETASGQIAKLTEQQNTLLGIDTAILSLTDAATAYQEAQLELDMMFTDEMLQKLDNELDLANISLELAQIAYDDEILRLDNILINAQSQLDTLLNIDTSVLSVAAAVNALQSIVSNPPPAPIEVTTSDEEAARNIAKLQTERLDSQEKTSKSIAKSLKTQEQLLRRIELNGAPA